jgi:DNA polymerase-3 subunit gamma/tau
MLEVTEAEAATLAEQSALATTDALTRILEILADAESRLRDAVSKKILMEVTMFKAVQARQATSLEAVLNRLQQLRESTRPDHAPAPSASASHPRPVDPPPSKPNPANAVAQTAPPAGAPTPPAAFDSDLEQIWTNIVEAVGRVSAFVRTYLLQGHPVSLEGKVFTIGFDPEFADNLHLVDNAKNRTLIQTKLHELGHAEVAVKFVQADAPAGRGAPAPTPDSAPPPAASAVSARPREAPKGKPEKAASAAASMDDFKNDPLIQQALEIFKGQIVEVRA